MHPLPSEDLEHILAHTLSLWPDLRGTSIFITGGTGFVGTWLVESLAWANQRLHLDIKATLLTRNPAGFRQRAPHLAGESWLSLLEGDARSFDFPEGTFQFVIHVATENQFAPTLEHPLASFERDVQGTRRVLEFARTHGTRRLLFTSSGAAYGKQPAELTHIPEGYPGAPSPLDPNSAYGQAKRISEFACAMYGRQYGFDAVLARLFAFVGPHLPLDLNFAVGNFLRDVMQGGPVKIGGDGTPYRSYLYAADLAIWLWTLLVHGEPARLYNVGSANEVTIAELARVVVDNTVPGTRIEIAQKPTPGAAPARYVPLVERAEKELGLKPLISLAEGVKRMYAWHLNANSR